MTTATRPPLSEILRQVANTVRCQLHNTRAGQLLAEYDPIALRSVESQLIGNLAQVVDGMITAATGSES